MVIRLEKMLEPPVMPNRESSPTAMGESGPREDFAEELQNAMGAVRENLGTADSESVSALVGGGEPHTAMIALTKAELSFKLLTQTRNKLVEAYREIMRLQM